MLSSKQIEIFYEVYKHSSMTAAANKMEDISTIYKQNSRSIEKNLGFKLFLEKVKN